MCLNLSLDGSKYSMYAAWSSLVDVLTNFLFEYAGCDGESSSLEEPDKVVAHQRSHGVQALVPHRLKGVDVDVHRVVFGHGGFGHHPEGVGIHASAPVGAAFRVVVRVEKFQVGTASDQDDHVRDVIDRLGRHVPVKLDSFVL